MNLDRTRRRSFAFTLVEVMVVIAFFVAMTAAVSVSVSQFSSHISLTNLAYEMAATIRQAQVYGVSVTERAGASSCKYQSGHGVAFYSNASDDKSYVMFADDPRDTSTCASSDSTVLAGQYNRRCGAPGVTVGSIGDCKDTPEYVKTFKLEKGNYISKFCAVKQDNSEDCSDSGLTYMTISFVRPNPEAFIRTSASTIINTASVPSSYDVPTNSMYKTAYIVISTPGSTKSNTVRVYTTGYISTR